MKDRAEYQRQYRAKNKEKCRAYSKVSHKKHRVKNLAYMKDRSRRLKTELISNLGGKCACCGEDKYEFLTLDHIHGGGHQHRLRCSFSRTTIYWEVKMQGFPRDKYRILCWNCNAAIGMFKKCPHGNLETTDLLKEMEG